ncbi:carbonyl reductase [Acrasis kona]|uniref:Carbonyl reductase n=1 Tax=Acrasis kona TaxID=1008807 RepID=A0AAW2YI92_9EUKA
MYCYCDVSDEMSVKNAFKNIETKFNHVDILVNSAGVNRNGIILQYPTQEMQQLIQTNVMGTIFTSKEAVKLMIKHKKQGDIVNISSVIGNGRNNPGQSIYASSKAAIVGFSKSLAKELIPKGIKVNIVAPGFVDTDMTKQVSVDQVKYVLGSSMADPQDISQGVIFLIESKYITGHVLTIDGGLTL